MHRVLLSEYDLSTFRLRQARQFWLALGGVLLFTAIVGKQMMGYQAGPEVLAWFIYLAGIVAIFIQPRFGLYLIAFFSLAGDMLLIPWYPFNKNFSSSESILFLSSSLKFSALELYLVVVILAWAVRQFTHRKLEFKPGALGLPVALFFGSILYGLLFGIIRHGNFTTALWESRAMLYLPILYFLTVNLIKDRREINTLVWWIMTSQFIQGLLGCWYYFFYPNGSKKGSDGIMEHSASIHLDSLFVLIMALFLFQGSKSKRTILILFALPGVWAYLVNQRRASFVSFGVALILLGVALYRQNRRVFWILAPPLAIFAVLFLGATWNNTGTLGLPARGIKSALGLGISSRDSASNDYRVIENINTNYNIHKSLLTGLGFGNKFVIVAPMPDISFFVWWEYITHNSIMWVWMQVGVFGWLTMAVMIGMTVAVGAHSYDRLPGGDYKAIGATMVLYILMHFVYAYVDMSWENQSMVFVGLTVGVIGCFDAVMARPVPAPLPRYRWLRPIPPEFVIPEED